MLRKAICASLCAGVLALSGACDRAGAPAATDAQEPAASQASGPGAKLAPSGDAATAKDGLDFGALQDRESPQRLLTFYANAVHSGEWAAAQQAWATDAKVTAAMLERQYGGKAVAKITVGTGDTEGAAGTVFYEAPIVVDYPDERPERRGTIVLRRANDTPGASQEQLAWRIERSSVLEPG